MASGENEFDTPGLVKSTAPWPMQPPEPSDGFQERISHPNQGLQGQFLKEAGKRLKQTEKDRMLLQGTLFLQQAQAPLLESPGYPMWSGHWDAHGSRTSQWLIGAGQSQPHWKPGSIRSNSLRASVSSSEKWESNPLHSEYKAPM